MHGQEPAPLLPLRLRPHLHRPVRQAGRRMDRRLLPPPLLQVPEGMLARYTVCSWSCTYLRSRWAGTRSDVRSYVLVIRTSTSSMVACTSTMQSCMHVRWCNVLVKTITITGQTYMRSLLQCSKCQIVYYCSTSLSNVSKTIIHCKLVL